MKRRIIVSMACDFATPSDGIGESRLGSHDQPPYSSGIGADLIAFGLHRHEPHVSYTRPTVDGEGAHFFTEILWHFYSIFMTVDEIPATLFAACGVGA